MPGLATLKLALLTLAACAAGQFTLHDVRGTPPAGFTHMGAAPAGQPITLRVGLASSNMAGLEAKLQSISHPGSAEYGKWLSAGTLSLLSELGYTC
jgi:tripeptidyl-peptidase-1